MGGAGATVQSDGLGLRIRTPLSNSNLLLPVARDDPNCRVIDHSCTTRVPVPDIARVVMVAAALGLAWGADAALSTCRRPAPSPGPGPGPGPPPPAPPHPDPSKYAKSVKLAPGVTVYFTVEAAGQSKKLKRVAMLLHYEIPSVRWHVHTV